MPKDPSLKKVLVTAPVRCVIGQAANSITPEPRRVRPAGEKWGVEVVLVNSNPATIMTDTPHGGAR